MALIAGLLLGSTSSAQAHFPAHYAYFVGSEYTADTVNEGEWQRSPWSGSRYGGRIDLGYSLDTFVLTIMTYAFEGSSEAAQARGDTLDMHHGSIWGRTRCRASDIYDTAPSVTISCAEYRSG